MGIYQRSNKYNKNSNETDTQLSFDNYFKKLQKKSTELKKIEEKIKNENNVNDWGKPGSDK